MKKIWKTRKDREGVSPVIATILMVAITVVLAAVLYVMVMGLTGYDDVPQPLGLNNGGQTSTTITILISSASDKARVDGTVFSLTKNGNITSIDNATLYGGDGLEDAWYTPSEGWKYGSGHDADSLKYKAGMKLKVRVNSGVSSGDEITINSEENSFMPTTYKV